jgi:hypothetical protein
LCETIDSLQKRLSDVKAAHAKQQEERTMAELGATSMVQEAAAAAQRAEQEGVMLSAKSSGLLSGLRKQLESALADTVQSDQLRKARLGDLESQHVQLEQKWRDAVNSLMQPDSAEREQVVEVEVQAELVPAESDASPFVASRGEDCAGQITLDAPSDEMYGQASAASIAKCLSYERFEPHSRSADPTSELPERERIAHSAVEPLQSGSSAEPFTGMRTAWSM